MPRHATIGALAGMAADFDFLPGFLIGELGRFHHAQSHSFAFAVLAAMLAMVLARNSALQWALLVGLAYASHVVVDFLTFDDSPPHGIPIFWPWSSEVFHGPVTLFLNVPWGSGFVLSPHNVNVLARELLFFGSAFFGSFWYLRRRRVSVMEDIK